VETKLVGDFGSIHSILGKPCQLCSSKTGLIVLWRAYRQILLVGEDQEHGVPQLVLVQHSLQLLTSLNNTVAIVAVDDEDDALRVLEVVPPEGSDFVLASDIPHGELDVLVLDSLDVEP